MYSYHFLRTVRKLAPFPPHIVVVVGHLPPPLPPSLPPPPPHRLYAMFRFAALPPRGTAVPRHVTGRGRKRVPYRSVPYVRDRSRTRASRGTLRCEMHEKKLACCQFWTARWIDLRCHASVLIMKSVTLFSHYYR